MKSNEILINNNLNEKLIKNIFSNLQKYLDENNIDSIIIGISGGIDSALSLFLLNKYIQNKKIYAYFIDIHSNQNDYNDARKIASFSNCECNYINLNDTFDSFKKVLNEKDQISLGNIKSRLRMITLYNYARKYNGIVIANTNLDEAYIGYFTKFGDGSGDYYPLINLTKSDIYYLAYKYHFPKNIIDKKPNSDLYESNLDDEKQLGIKYIDIDNYLRLCTINENIAKKIEHLHNKNKHKLIYNINYVSKLKYRKLNEKK